MPSLPLLSRQHACVYIPCMQQSRESNTGPRTSNTLPGAAALLQYYCTYFSKKSSILQLARAAAVYIHNHHASSTVVVLPAARPSELPTRAPLVYHSYSCTSRASLHTRAPLVHHSYSCTSCAPFRTRAPLWTFDVAGPQYSGSHCLILALS